MILLRKVLKCSTSIHFVALLPYVFTSAADFVPFPSLFFFLLRVYYPLHPFLLPPHSPVRILYSPFSPLSFPSTLHLLPFHPLMPFPLLSFTLLPFSVPSPHLLTLYSPLPFFHTLYPPSTSFPTALPYPSSIPSTLPYPSSIPSILPYPSSIPSIFLPFFHSLYPPSTSFPSTLPHPTSLYSSSPSNIFPLFCILQCTMLHRQIQEAENRLSESTKVIASNQEVNTPFGDTLCYVNATL